MIASGGSQVDWSNVPDIQDIALLFVSVALVSVVVGLICAAVSEWLDDRRAKVARENKLREAREFRDEFQRTKPSRPCDVCTKHPTTLYFDGFMLIDLCPDCAREAGEAGIRG